MNLARFVSVLKLRSRLSAAVRGFFLARDYVEVETPVMVHTPALELHIDALPAGNGFLRTSPEFHMKRLLCAGYERIFQIGSCFRAGEMGWLHNPEFAMLEWYRVKADYKDILKETRDLLISTAQQCLGGTTLDSTLNNPKSRIQNPKLAGGRLGGEIIDLAEEWRIFSVAELFEKYAGWNPVDNFDERRFDDDLVNLVEPRLPKDRPVVLMDYPAQAGAFARLKPGDNKVAERWELYLAGIEIANAFSELTDAVEQRQRFEECARKRREMEKPVYALDQEFIMALQQGLPPSAGVALGIDRLIMLFAGADSLDDVIPFR